MAEQSGEAGASGSDREVFEERVRFAQVEARARNISHNVRCLECGHQAIEDSQADIAIKLRKVIRDELRSGMTDKEIYKKLTTEYGETVLYSPAFDAQSAVLWLLPVLAVGAIAGLTFYRGRRQVKDVGTLTDTLLHGIPLSVVERIALAKVVKPPTSPQFGSSVFQWGPLFSYRDLMQSKDVGALTDALVHGIPLSVVERVALSKVVKSTTSPQFGSSIFQWGPLFTFRGLMQSKDFGALTDALVHGIPLSVVERIALAKVVKPPTSPHFGSSIFQWGPVFSYRNLMPSKDVGALTDALVHGIPLSVVERVALSKLVKPPTPPQLGSSIFHWGRRR